MAKIFIEIVDASVIDEPSAGVENRRLWRNLRLTLFHQNMLRVAKRRKGVAEFTIVLANGVCPDKPKKMLRRRDAAR